MIKKLLVILFSFFLIGITPSVAYVQLDEEIAWDMEAITISFQNNRVHVTNAEGKYLEIFNLTGVRAARIRIDSNDKHININLPRGCYLIKVEKVVRKVSVL